MAQYISLQSNNDSINLNLLHWPTKEAPKAVIQIIHGMAEYIERYDAFAQYLNHLGFAVIGHDHLGHGKSVEEVKPTYGYFDDNAQAGVLTDIQRVKTWGQSQYNNLPYFMLGHSMGSFALRSFLQESQEEIDGAIFMGTGTSPKILPVILPIITRLAEHNPKKINTFIDKMAFGSFSKKFPEDGNFNWLSKNQDNVKQYENDPLMGFTFTNNGFSTLFSLVKKANQTGWAKNISKTLPILIVSGDQDPVGDFGAGPKQVQNQLLDAGIQDVTLNLFPTLRHEILLENEKEEVYQVIGNWLKIHLPK